MPAVCDARAGADPRLPSGSETSAADDDASLREALKRCPAATYQAAVRFKKTGDARHLPAIILGIIERFVEPDQRSRLNHSPENLRLVEDLGIDSLTMMEIVMLVEDVLAITINHEDLRGLHTLGQVRRFIEVRLGGDPSTGPA